MRRTSVMRRSYQKRSRLPRGDDRLLPEHLVLRVAAAVVLAAGVTADLPSSVVAVAAVGGVAEEAEHGVRAHGGEEVGGRYGSLRPAVRLATLDRREDLVLLGRREVDEGLREALGR